MNPVERHRARPGEASCGRSAELNGLIGTELGTSDWYGVTQEHVNLFADATGDHQWIHVDVERATEESPFGGPTAHGYPTLSLLVPLFGRQLTFACVIEREGGDKLVCIDEPVYRYYWG